MISCPHSGMRPHPSIRVADENEFAGEEILERGQFLVLPDHGVGGLFPRQADVDAKTILRAGALVAGLHDARASARDDHEAGPDNLPPKLDGLLIFLLVGLGAGGAEHGNFAEARVRGKEFEGVTQLPQRGLNHAYVAGVLHVGQQLERIFNDVPHQFGVVSSALVSDEVLDEPLQLGVLRRFSGSIHGVKVIIARANATLRIRDSAEGRQTY